MNRIDDVIFQAKLDQFLEQFDLDDQERILQYAIDHVLPRLRGKPVRSMSVQGLSKKDPPYVRKNFNDWKQP